MPVAALQLNVIQTGLNSNERSASATIIILTTVIVMLDAITIDMQCKLLPQSKLGFSFFVIGGLHQARFVHELSSLQLKLMLDIIGFEFSHFTSYPTLDSLIDIEFAVPLLFIADFVSHIIFIVFVV